MLNAALPRGRTIRGVDAGSPVAVVLVAGGVAARAHVFAI